MDEDETCDHCGKESDRLTIGSRGGDVCMDCYDDGPVCDDSFVRRTLEFLSATHERM